MTGPIVSLQITLIILMTKGSLVRLHVQIAIEPMSAQPRTRRIAHQSTTHQTPAHEAPRTGARVTLLPVTSRQNTPTGTTKLFRITRVQILFWVRSRRKLSEGIDRSRKDTYQGHAYNGANLTPIVELPNHVPQEFDAWVDKAVAAVVGKGRIARWSEVEDVFTHPKPEVTLLVGMEPTNPWIICDARNLNLLCEHSEFKMNGVGKVAQCS